MGIVFGFLTGFDWTSVDYVQDISLDDDGYYWYLHRFFAELFRQTGQNIDLYDNAALTGSEIAMFEAAMNRARDTALEQPECWEVHVGNETAPVSRALYRDVDRMQMVGIIDCLLVAARTARDRGLTLAFLGD